MNYTQQEIEMVLFEARSLRLAKIVRHFEGFVIFAQNEKDYEAKVRRIKEGDRNGFYTIEYFIDKFLKQQS